MVILERIKENKKMILKVGAMLAVVIIAVFGCFLIFFNNSPVGTWKLNEGQAETILTLKNDGTASIQVDSIKVDGTYELSGGDAVKINIKTDSQNQINDEYKYEVKSGLTSRSLSLTSSQGKKVTYTQSKPKEIKGSDNFTPVKEVLGTWENKSVKFEYELTNKGIAIFRKDNTTIKLTYTVDDTNITFKQSVNGKNQENVVKYSVGTDELFLNGMRFTKKA
ncbi:MAG: hypothetical protein RUMPE_00747 [Eubacteriales bacterium SKADARSKE-1]|nr:hypothetical protein [Eubacteriales bacterium SKADARSKE-1]